MTENTIYKRTLQEFNDAVSNHIVTCDAVKAHTATEQHALTSLNLLISLGWRLKDAALLREPAPLPPRAVKGAAQRRKDKGNVEASNEQ